MEERTKTIVDDVKEIRRNMQTLLEKLELVPKERIKTKF